MKRVVIIASAAAAAALSACSMQGAAPAAASSAAKATVEILDSAGKTVGTATATQIGETIRIRVEAAAMPAGSHGAHVHAVGACTAPDFASAGPHWNPTSHQHGKDNPAGMHMGDLPNLAIGRDGRGTIEYSIPAASISGGPNPLLDADGAAIVIHAQADDYRTDPSGNSGGRIACGIFH
jgi:Cu-Zn family superoxide dismutase